MYLLRKGHKESYSKPGDVLVAEDGRSAYVIDKNGSNRRIKDKNLLVSIMVRFQELKKADDDKKAAAAAAAAERKAVDDAPLTGVNPSKIREIAAMLSMGAALGGPAGPNLLDFKTTRL
jgi:hypothetical protein